MWGKLWNTEVDLLLFFVVLVLLLISEALHLSLDDETDKWSTMKRGKS